MSDATDEHGVERRSPAVVDAGAIDLGLGDYLRAVAALDDRDDEGTRARIARILGVAPDVGAPASLPSPRPSAPATTGTLEVTLDALVSDRFDRPPRPDAPPSGPALDDDIAVVAAPEAAAQVPATPTEQVPRFSGKRAERPLATLFDPPRSRALLTSALATTIPDGEIDGDALVRMVARATPVPTLPRLLRSTLARGAQIVIDLSEGMLPFRRDQTDLLQRIDRLIADGLVSVVTIEGDPTQTWSNEARRNIPFPPPPSGTPVIALTDLGIRARLAGRPRASERWLDLAARLQRAEAPLLALVPYPPERWPAALSSKIAMVPWDRGTRVAQVQRMARIARSRS